MTFLEFVNCKGYSIPQIAKKAGINHRALYEYTYGRHTLENMRAGMIVPLAEALGVMPKELLALDKPKSS